MSVVETVEVVHPSDPAQIWRINRASYDPAVHVLWEERDRAKVQAEEEVIEEPRRRGRRRG